jgi:N utilization substance protein A
VVQELRGERIDIIPWAQDPIKYVCNALAPAKISRVEYEEENRHMDVVVADDQLSLAIGKRGQNVRLGSKLTGLKIDIKSESKMEKISAEVLERFKDLPYIGDVGSRALYNEGFRSVQGVAEADPDDLAKLLEMNRENAAEIVESAVQLNKKGEPTKEKEGPVETKGEPSEPVLSDSSPPLGPTGSLVDQLEGVGEKTAQVLKSNGFQTVQDILKSDVEHLSSLPGIGAKKAEKLIQTAREYSGGKERA